MRVALGGMFRNSTGYLARYFGQVLALEGLLKARGDQLRLILAEGDSSDHTWSDLARRTVGFDAVLVKRDHHGPWWGSVDDMERWRALSWVCNGILDHVSADVDALVYVETDLLWTPETLVKMVDQLSAEHPAISPMCFTEDGPFYDIWGHCKDGVYFQSFPPYHPELGDGLTKVDSTGSAVCMLGSVARRVRYGPDLVRGLGRSIYKEGFTLWVDPSLKVVHPC